MMPISRRAYSTSCQTLGESVRSYTTVILASGLPIPPAKLAIAPWRTNKIHQPCSNHNQLCATRTRQRWNANACSVIVTQEAAMRTSTFFVNSAITACTTSSSCGGGNKRAWMYSTAEPSLALPTSLTSESRPSLLAKSLGWSAALAP